jgi:hypothetical protein
MRTQVLWRSFAGGEVTPELLGRVDLDKFVTGLLTAENFLVLPHGPISNRAGFQYVLKAKDSTRKVRLLPFTFSADQTFALEFGHQYVRFHTQGGTLLETPIALTTVSTANPALFNTAAAHGLTTGQWVFLDNLAGPATLNDRYFEVVVTSATQFSLKDMWGVAVSTLSLAAHTGGTGTFARVYTITTPYVETDLFDIHYDQSGDIVTLTHPSYQPRELKRLGATNWTLTTVVAGASVPPPSGVTVTASAAGAISYSYVVTSIAAGGVEESIASVSDSDSNDLSIAGRTNTVTYLAAAGAVRYNVYKQKNGLYGFIGQTDSLTFVDDNITPDTTRTPPEFEDPYSLPGDYPAAVAHWDQRRVFAGTNNRPQTFGLSNTGTESNFNASFPSKASDAFFARIANEQNRILHLVTGGDLLALTAGSEQKIYSLDTDVLTPDSVGARKQTEYGASNVQPVTTGNSVLYVQSGGSKVRDMKFNDAVQKYASEDLTLLFSHRLSVGRYIVDMTFARTPWPILWCVRDDGVLLGCTYVPEQKVFGWHAHFTDGAIESATAVREGNYDVLYCVVRRTINSQTVRYIERMPTREWASLEDAYHVDSGLTYSGPAAATLSGFHHLEGETISILANGAVEAPKVVVNGAVTLETLATKAHGGLPIQANAQPTPLVAQTPDGGISVEKNIRKIYLKVVRTSGLFTGPDFATLRDALLRYDEPMGSPPEWKTETLELDMDPSWDLDKYVCVRQSDPLPVTITAIGAEVEIAD